MRRAVAALLVGVGVGVGVVAFAGTGCATCLFCCSDVASACARGPITNAAPDDVVLAEMPAAAPTPTNAVQF